MTQRVHHRMMPNRPSEPHISIAIIDDRKLNQSISSNSIVKPTIDDIEWRENNRCLKSVLREMERYLTKARGSIYRGESSSCRHSWHRLDVNLMIVQSLPSDLATINSGNRWYAHPFLTSESHVVVVHNQLRWLSTMLQTDKRELLATLHDYWYP